MERSVRSRKEAASHMRHVTIKDIARIAGVSTSTVSRALSGSKELSEATRERIVKICNEQGYRVNALARSLIRSRTNVIGLIVPEVTNPFYAEVSLGIETHARQLGYNVMLCNSQQDAKTTEELFGFLTSHQVDGIILANSHSNAPRWIQQFAPHLPTVLLGTPASLSGDEVNSVCIDNLAGGRLAAEYLLSLGHRSIAFGLNIQKLPKDEVNRRIEDALARMQIGQYVDRYPSELSGGQQQRVAIARAIASEPHLLLMDEPLSNLDAKLRVDMRSELKRLHIETGTTMIYVTHDQVEALTMSTKIAIFKEGVIIQVAPPLELYNNPVNLYVADFIGNPSINFADGKAEVGPDGMTVSSPLGKMVFPKKDLTDMLPKEKSFDAVLGIRPEQIAINTTRQSPSDIEAHIYTSMPAGSETLVTVKVGGVSLVIKALGITHYNPDQVVYLSIDLNKINVFDKKSTKLIKYSV